MTRPFMTSADVAAQLGLPSAAAFLARRARMEADMLFPRPMPHCARPLLWRGEEVAAWVDRNGRPAAPDLPMIDPGLIASGKIAVLNMARSA